MKAPRAARQEEPGRAKPAPLRLFACGCGTRHLSRIDRVAWMRLLPRFRLYRCANCGARVLRTRIRQRLYGPVYLPAPPFRSDVANLLFRGISNGGTGLFEGGAARPGDWEDLGPLLDPLIASQGRLTMERSPSASPIALE